jgi:hypothetical protein
MNIAAQPDRLEVVNGPEDGTQFPVTRVPIDLGSDVQCAVHLRFDQHIDDVMARISVVDGGYRVRRTGQGTLLIDGKRVGRVRSQILRHGSILTAGSTEICLQLAGHGLASRSYGMNLESDASWMARMVYQQGGAFVAGLFRGTFRFARRHPVITIIILLAVGAFLYAPAGGPEVVFYWINRGFQWAVYYLSQALRTLQTLLG